MKVVPREKYEAIERSEEEINAHQLAEVYCSGWKLKIWDRVADFVGNNSTKEWYQVFEAQKIDTESLKEFFTEKELKKIMNYDFEKEMARRERVEQRRLARK